MAEMGLLHYPYERRLYDLGPCLPETEVQAFEDQHQIRLPAEYRHFLLEVGNGGAGPLEGLLPLAKTIQLGPWQHRLNASLPMQQELAKPFPLTIRWLVYDRMLQEFGWSSAEWRVLDEILEEADVSDLRQWAAPYFEDVESTHGVLTLAAWPSYNFFYLLVVTGSERGNIWADDAERLSIYPAPHPELEVVAVEPVVDDMDLIWRVPADDKPHCDFLTWYEGWLDRELRRIGFENLFEPPSRMA